MGIWSNKDRGSILEDAESLAHPAEFSPWTKWFTGCFVAGALAVYACYGWARGHIIQPMLKGRSEQVIGPDVGWIAAAYLAMAAFTHFHCFWSLHPPLMHFAKSLKVAALVVLLPCLIVIAWRALRPWILMAA